MAELTHYTTGLSQPKPSRPAGCAHGLGAGDLIIRQRRRYLTTVWLGALLAWIWIGGAVWAADPSESISLAFVGDVMLGRWIGEQIDRYGDDYALGPVSPLLRRATIAHGNLESPLTTAPYQRRGYNLVARPARIASLVGAGFDVVALANNHVTDHGAEGVLETIRTLDESGIGHVGAGATMADARRAWVAEIGSLRVAYLAYDSTWGSAPATEGSPGSVHPDNQVVDDIAQAREVADLVVVSIHWGQEYHDLPNKQQQNYARALAGAGADIVVGHHPHVVQPLSWIQAPGRDRLTLVAYSLGNFIFDQEFSAKTSESALLWCEVSARGTSSARLIPLHIRHGQVRPVDTRAGEQVLLRLLPRDQAQGPLRAFCVATLPDGQRDFQIAWVLGSEQLIRPSPSTTDVNGDGAPESIAFREYGLCVRSLRADDDWCTSPQWQVGSAWLEDVDGDGLAELVTRAQQNEETAPAWGEFVQVWEWRGGGFGLDWRSIPGDYRAIWTADVDGDGIRDIGVGDR